MDFVASAATSGAELPVTLYVGSVSLVWAPGSTAVLASFTTPGSASTPGSCPDAQTGSCCAYSQPQIVISTGGAEPVSVGAGTITVSAGSRPIGGFQFSGFGYIPLSSAVSPSVTWNPGDRLEVSATGATVGSFAGTVAAPSPFTSVAPSLSLGGSTPVLRANDFTVTWAPPAGSSGTVILELFDPVGFYVDCSAPDAAGAITVPSPLLTTFAPGDTGYITLTRSSSQPVQALNASVMLTAEARAVGNASYL